jgi:tetratricopeptide (TPR) repeat protein
LLPPERQLLDAAMVHVEEELVLSGVELLSVLLADDEEEKLVLAFDNYGTTDNLDKDMINGIARAYIVSADKIRLTDSTLAAARYLRAGELLLSVDNKKRAQEVMQNSVDLNPANTAAVEQHARLSRELVDQYHLDASHAFRRQELDIAIDLWQRALAIDPFHTPSLNNLVQAEELKQKLDQVR